MKRMVKKGFTLVEILIVVIILGILAAIVIPQFTEASAEARISNLVTNLQTVRSQVLLYKTQHVEAYPGVAGDPDTDFGNQMMHYTNAAGDVSLVPNPPNYIFGPYLQQVPVNPISGLNTVRSTDTAAEVFAPGATDGGWWFNRITGEFRADLLPSWVKPDGTILNTL
jgi:general secretion pathway protein G